MSSRPDKVISAGARLAAKARADRSARRRRHGRRSALTLTGLLGLGVVAWVLLSSSLLAVRTVVVTGASGLTAVDVRLAAEVERGVPLARVDAAAVVHRVGALPAVASVRVIRDWPSTLVVQVHERVPVVGMVTEQGVVLVDAGGVPFGSVATLPAGLVRLQVFTEGPTDPTTRAALAVLAELPPRMRARVGILRAASPSSVTLVLRDGRQVLWGGPGQPAQKSAAAEALLAMPGTFFDVSRPGVVTRR